MLDWLIIGGGIHGTYLANLILNQCAVKGRKKVSLHVLDPEPRLMSRWYRFTTNTGMDFLRSPRVHHIDIAPNSLHEFARDDGQDFGKCYTEPYFRPNLDLFCRHSESVISRSRLHEFFIRGRATQVKESSNCLSISSTAGTLNTRSLLLCIGLSNQPHWPEWANELRSQRGCVQHIFDDDTQLIEKAPPSSVAIIGGGLTAAQTALSYSRRGCPKVIIITRHPQRTNQFDADPGWIGLKYLNDFYTINDFSIRRNIIDGARNRGSIPTDVLDHLKQHIAHGRIKIIHGEVSACDKCTDNTLLIMLNSRDLKIGAHKIILATGFHNKRPGGDFIDQTIDELNLPCAGCGYPIVDQGLRWHPRIFVSGPLSELEIGPVARNIIGARLVGKRLRSVL